MRNKFAATLLTMVANSHLWHFLTSSYAAHMAFGDFYEKLQGLADSYIEADIGVHGKIRNEAEPFYYKDLDSSVQALRSFRLDVKAIRDAQEHLGHNGLVTTLEEIMALVDGTLYKLNNLQ